MDCSDPKFLCCNLGLSVDIDPLSRFCWLSTSIPCQVAMECAAAAGCDDSIVKFVLPLGTTVNMNGTAL